MSKISCDVVVIGAGVFGTWTAHELQQAGARVVLVDAFGVGNSRSSSGGESRIIRMGYGPDEIYSRLAMRSFDKWQGFIEEREAFHLFRKTGVLWLAKNDDAYCEASLKVLAELGVKTTRLNADELGGRYPQFNFAEFDWGFLEHDSGAMLARQAVQMVASRVETNGATVLTKKIVAPLTSNRIDSIKTTDGEQIHADDFVFACGPWLPKVFPELLINLFHITRQEVFFFGTAAGDSRFTADSAPIWIDFNEFVYAIPDLEQRGFKIAIDRHGPAFDPDDGDRIVTPERLDETRSYVGKRIPLLADAPVVESRVCQYENTSNGDFVIDRHPEIPNVWLVGGGSGHGFKHGPAVGEYVVRMIETGHNPEPRFLLATKGTIQKRSVF